MVILLNKYSNDGNGLRKWKKYEKELERIYIGKDYKLVSDFGACHKELMDEVEKGERLMVAAGGDGTVNFLVNEIMHMKESVRRELVLGAIGLGSSNDFHKPYAPDHFLSGRLPVKLDDQHWRPHNVGEVAFEDEKGTPQRKYFIVNCSLGIIAQANDLFNAEDKVIKRLKAKWTNGTIWYSALKTLFAAPNIPAVIDVDGRIFSTEITSLSIIINPHVSGSLCYDIPVTPQSDIFGIALCEHMGQISRMRTLASLSFGRFQGLPKTRVWLKDRIEIHPLMSTPLELDGEVCRARSIKIRLLRGILRVCQ